MEVAIGMLGALAALVGHIAITVWLFNRVHARPWRRKIVKTLEKVLLLASFMISLLLAWQLLQVATAFDLWLRSTWLLQIYAALCWLAALAAIPLWVVPKLLERTPAALLTNDTTTVDVLERIEERPLVGVAAKLLFHFPGNEILRLGIHTKTIQLTRLPTELSGLRIAHLSDLHMTGQLGKAFYDVVVDETNALAPDLVVITGDILEKTKCLPWIMPTLGRLRAREGKYFVLGNHEQRLPEAGELRAALTEAGLIDLGSRCLSVSLRGAEVTLAGTEVPWFGTSPEMPAVCGSEEAGQTPFRMLLSHSPDQFFWAQAQSIDLMLAGHTHGGQIRIPYIGAVVAPSNYGFRYAGGLYHQGTTVLHVSRGLAGIQPIRLNCLPEIALLILKPT